MWTQLSLLFYLDVTYFTRVLVSLCNNCCEINIYNILEKTYVHENDIDLLYNKYNNNNICLKSNIQTSSVDYAPRELTHILYQ